MDDLTRAHRNHVSDLDDTLRRVKAHLATAHEQLVNVPLLQSKVDQFKEQVLQLTHESKVLAIEVGSLQAENARLTLANSQESRTEANPVAINIPAEIAAARAEALQYKLENDRLRLEVEYKCREMDAQAANMKTLESRKDFLSKSLTELEDHMVRLSGQVIERCMNGKRCARSAPDALFLNRSLLPVLVRLNERGRWGTRPSNV